MLLKNYNFLWEGLKYIVEKEKILVTIVFSFSHNVFKRLLSQGRYKSGLCSKELKWTEKYAPSEIWQNRDYLQTHVWP